MLVAIDLGNSSIKLGTFEGDRLIATERFEGGPAIADGVIPSPHVAQADEVVVGASAPAHLAVLLRAIDRPARVLDREIVTALPTTYERPEELGIDRLAAVYGARAVTGGGSGVVVADVGTAVTVDALDARGRFVAVAIAPGVRSAADGLARAAPHLPRVATTDPVRTPARGTEDSLRTGIVVGAAGLVERLVCRARDEVGGDAPVVLTGGDAELVSPWLDGLVHRVAPHCVLHGLRALHHAVPVGAA
jgi:type III pantothenate kinase